MEDNKSKEIIINNQSFNTAATDASISRDTSDHRLESSGSASQGIQFEETSINIVNEFDARRNINQESGVNEGTIANDDGISTSEINLNSVNKEEIRNDAKVPEQGQILEQSEVNKVDIPNQKNSNNHMSLERSEFKEPIKIQEQKISDKLPERSGPDGSVNVQEQKNLYNSNVPEPSRPKESVELQQRKVSNNVITEDPLPFNRSHDCYTNIKPNRYIDTSVEVYFTGIGRLIGSALSNGLFVDEKLRKLAVYSDEKTPSGESRPFENAKHEIVDLNTEFLKLQGVLESMPKYTPTSQNSRPLQPQSVFCIKHDQ